MTRLISQGDFTAMCRTTIADWLSELAFYRFPGDPGIGNRALPVRRRLEALLLHASDWDWRKGRERFETR